MRLPFKLIVATAALLTFATTAIARPLEVSIDQSTRISLPTAARDVVIGNPAIADVSVLDGRTIMVLGRSFGMTSLLVTDTAGRTILNTQILVANNDNGTVSVFRGAQVQTFACASRCERAMPSAAPAAAPPATTP